MIHLVRNEIAIEKTVTTNGFVNENSNDPENQLLPEPEKGQILVIQGHLAVNERTGISIVQGLPGI